MTISVWDNDPLILYTYNCAITIVRTINLLGQLPSYLFGTFNGELYINDGSYIQHYLQDEPHNKTKQRKLKYVELPDFSAS